MNNPEMIAEYRAAKAAAEAEPAAKSLARKATRLRDAIVMANKGLVYRVAKRILGSRKSAKDSPDLEEAVQEGYIGLMRAIEEFDESRGSQFSTVAALWIRHHVQNCKHKQVDFAKQRSACMPPKAKAAQTLFRTLHGREPEPHEITFEWKGAKCTPTREQWDKWLDSTVVQSVEEMSAGADDERQNSGSYDLIADPKTSPDAVVASTHLQAKLEAALEEMSPRNRAMARMLFVDGMQIADVAEHYGISVGRVKELKAVFEKRLRKVLTPALS